MNAEQQFRAKAPAIMHRLMADFPSLGVDDAAAILGNLGQECAGFTKLQEIAPTVKGSRGGYGWAQWTGPRRRAYEAYCKRTGKDPASDEANYAYLFLELKGIEGSEGGAIAKLVAANGLEAKVEAFERAFLRAGTPNYPSRLTWAQRALDAVGPIPVMPAPTPPVEEHEEGIAGPQPVTASTRPGWLAMTILIVLAALAGIGVFLLRHAPAASDVSLLGAPVPYDRPLGFYGGGGGIDWTSVVVSIALAFVGPLAGAVATFATGWIVYWWQRLLKSEFDAKSTQALHDALERGMQAALEQLGSRASKTRLVASAVDHAQKFNAGAVKHFKLSRESLEELAVSHLVTARKAAAR